MHTHRCNSSSSRVPCKVGHAIGTHIYCRKLVYAHIGARPEIAEFPEKQSLP